MIWYLHWLQMRRTVMAGALTLATGGLLFYYAIQRREPVDAHYLALALPTMVAVVYLAGNGLLRGHRGSNFYSLSLPVSRKKLIGSRMAAGWMLVGILLVLLLGLNSGLLALLNKPIPWGAMAQGSFLAFMSAAPALVLGGLLRFYMDDRWATYLVWAVSWSFIPGLGLAAKGLPWSNWTMTPGMIVSYSAIATAVLVTLTLQLGQRKEF